MDPITQGAVGLAASRLSAKRSDNWLAALIGVMSGMAADIDILIKSQHDPLLALEFHRHFTHSLIFIPIGAFICALLLHGLLPAYRKRMPFSRTWLYATAGYATHALLDACTTYGTQLLWPFSNMRVAWNIISVIDPIFTLTLISLLIIALIKNAKSWFIGAAGFALAYLSLGTWQNHRATEVAEQLAHSRGHQGINLGVKPSFANIIVWKSVYEHEQRYYVDAIRVFEKTRVIEGSSSEKLNLGKHFPWLKPESQQAKDIERFRWFSNGHLGLDPENPNRIIDTRYSLLPNEITGLWGIELDPNASGDEHIKYTEDRGEPEEVRKKASQLWEMVKGN